MTQKEFVPKHTYRTRSKPCVVRGTEMELGWIGKAGEPARGMLYSTERLVHDNPRNMTRTIQNASRKERLIATPMDERFHVLMREEITVRRLHYAANPTSPEATAARKRARDRKHKASRK